MTLTEPLYYCKSPPIIQIAVNKHGYLELNLSNKNLHDIPAETFNFARLEALKLGQNRLRSLPTSMGKLRRLKILHAQQNAIVVLPDTIANCAHLTEVGTLQYPDSNSFISKNTQIQIAPSVDKGSI